jgi:hypothetical protein
MKIVAFPPLVNCAAFLPVFDFADAYGVLAPAGLDTPEAARLAFAHAPQSAAILINLRDRLIAPFGLKLAPAKGFPAPSLFSHRCDIGGRLYLTAIMSFHRLIARLRRENRRSAQNPWPIFE